jgi:hypothetical protein
VEGYRIWATGRTRWRREKGTTPTGEEGGGGGGAMTFGVNGARIVRAIALPSAIHTRLVEARMGGNGAYHL